MPENPKSRNNSKTRLNSTQRTRSTTRSTNNQQTIDTNPQSLTPKRKVSDTSPTKSPEAKKITQSKMTTPVTLADIASLLKEQTAAIKDDIKNEIKIIGEELKASFHYEITKLHERVDAIETNASSRLMDLKTDVDKCVNRLNNTDDNLARIGKLNELKINGIAHTNNENLHDIFCSIAKLIGYDITNPLNIPDIARMHKRNNHNNDFLPLPSIIVKFVATHIRNTFYGLYLARATKEPILSEHINLPQGSTIRIGEMLTPQNQMIFTEAIKLKRDKKLSKVNTVDGLVRVKAGQTERFVTIRSQRELDTYVTTKMNSSSLTNASSEIISAVTSNGSVTTLAPAPAAITTTTNMSQAPIPAASATSSASAILNENNDSVKQQINSTGNDINCVSGESITQPITHQEMEH